MRVKAIKMDSDTIDTPDTNANSNDAKKYEIGVLNSIRFQNADNGFLIGQFQDQARARNLFMALGNILQPEIGLAYKLYGQWVNNAQWGQQFKFDFYEVLQPTDTKGIYQYLVRVCKWVGPTVAGRIVDKYQAESLEILKANPERVAREIAGITLERAKEIQSGLMKNAHIEKVLVELERIFSTVAGARKSLPMELVSLHGSDAVVKLKENPYLLTYLKGVGFPTADRVALAMGFDTKATAREKAAAWHVLNENMHTVGSVWAEVATVKREVARLTGLAGDRGVAEMVKQGIAVEYDGLVAVAEVARNETYIAEKIARLMHVGTERSEAAGAGAAGR